MLCVTTIVLVFMCVLFTVCTFCLSVFTSAWKSYLWWTQYIWLFNRCVFWWL